MSALFSTYAQTFVLVFWTSLGAILSFAAARRVRHEPLLVVLYSVRGCLCVVLVAVHGWYLFHQTEQKWWADAVRGLGTVIVPVFYVVSPALTLWRRRKNRVRG